MRVLLLLLLFLFIGPAVSGGASNDGLIKGIGGHPNEFRGSAHEYSELVSGMKFNSFRTDYYWSNYERTPGVFITPNDKYQVVLNLLSKKILDHY